MQEGDECADVCSANTKSTSWTLLCERYEPNYMMRTKLGHRVIVIIITIHCISEAHFKRLKVRRVCTAGYKVLSNYNYNCTGNMPDM